jgi:hypothetical protein
MKIYLIIKKKNINLMLFKVKEHSKDELNDAADTLAKEGGNSDKHLYNLFNHNLSNIKFFPYYKHFPIE